jgi:arylformamidase
LSSVVDVSVPLRNGLPGWPKQKPFERTIDRDVNDGDRLTLSTIALSVHTGTHMDAPIHFESGGVGIDRLDLDRCIGPCWVADLTGLGGAIGATDLEAAGIPSEATRILAKTRNSGWSRDTGFRENFCAYDGSGAEWLVERGFVFVGIDYLSIEPWGSQKVGNPTHHGLLQAGVVIVEGVDLDGVDEGFWEVIALPMPIADGDGAPARVILRRD